MTGFRNKKLLLFQVQLTDDPANKEIFKFENLLYHIINISIDPLPPESRNALAINIDFTIVRIVGRPPAAQNAMGKMTTEFSKK